ncbi:extensin-like isoform X1 [Haliotis rubra]|uniref:extensin-like isoform X1 n=1 Tax=Haliotis rubra TaxID=36100 RepID=UPI001EE5D62A|nr:extensin-like isoform X1 [Haliotis rubra]
MKPTVDFYDMLEVVFWRLGNVLIVCKLMVYTTEHYTIGVTMLAWSPTWWLYITHIYVGLITVSLSYRSLYSYLFQLRLNHTPLSEEHFPPLAKLFPLSHSPNHPLAFLFLHQQTHSKMSAASIPFPPRHFNLPLFTSSRSTCLPQTYPSPYPLHPVYSQVPPLPSSSNHFVYLDALSYKLNAPNPPYYNPSPFTYSNPHKHNPTSCFFTYPNHPKHKPNCLHIPKPTQAQPLPVSLHTQTIPSTNLTAFTYPNPHKHNFSVSLHTQTHTSTTTPCFFTYPRPSCLQPCCHSLAATRYFKGPI